MNTESYQRVSPAIREQQERDGEVDDEGMLSIDDEREMPTERAAADVIQPSDGVDIAAAVSADGAETPHPTSRAPQPTARRPASHW